MVSTGFGGLAALSAPEQKKLAIWRNATPIIGFDENVYRRDTFGRAMRYSDYGDRSSDYGWEIDHILATVLGGSDEIWNLRALHWRNNASLGGLLSSIGR